MTSYGLFPLDGTISSIYHAEYSLYINILKAFFQKIVMGDR